MYNISTLTGPDKINKLLNLETDGKYPGPLIKGVVKTVLEQSLSYKKKALRLVTLCFCFLLWVSWSCLDVTVYNAFSTVISSA